MRKSLVHWLRKLVLMGLASTSCITFNNIYAHDLPIFDSLSPINCFGIGSCGFPMEARLSDLPNLNASELDAEVNADESEGGWSFANCFGNSCDDPLGRADLPTQSSSSAELNRLPRSSLNQSAHQLDEVEALAVVDQQTDVEASSLSYPVSSLTLIQAVAIQIPKFEVTNSWKQLPKALLAYYQTNSTPSNSTANIKEPNYLNSRPFVDDYLAGESFVRDWRADESYRGLNRLDYMFGDRQQVIDTDVGAEPLAVGVPQHHEFDASVYVASVLGEFDNIRCIVSQELTDFRWTAVVSQRAGGSLANLELSTSAALNTTTNKISNWAALQPKRQSNASSPIEFVQADELFGQPSFVIYQLEGKEFLLPAKQAKHWNSVPSFPIGIGSLSTQSPRPAEVETFDPAVFSKLAISVSNGFEVVTSQLQRIASQLRIVAQEESQIANRSEKIEGIR